MKTSFIVRLLVTAFLLVSSAVFLNSYNHFFDLTKESLGKYFNVRWFLFGHIIPGGVALLTGPALLLKEVRNKSMKAHRWLGKVYVLCVLVSSVCALCLTFVTTNRVGYMYTVSIWFMLLAWVSTTGIAYWTVRRRMIAEHEEWMVRSYMVTFAFIVQNYILKIPMLMSLGTFAEVSPNIFWFSWSLPLLGYQVYLTIIRKAKTSYSVHR